MKQPCCVQNVLSSCSRKVLGLQLFFRSTYSVLIYTLCSFPYFLWLSTNEPMGTYVLFSLHDAPQNQPMGMCLVIKFKLVIKYSLICFIFMFSFTSEYTHIHTHTHTQVNTHAFLSFFLFFLIAVGLSPLFYQLFLIYSFLLL